MSTTRIRARRLFDGLTVFGPSVVSVVDGTITDVITEPDFEPDDRFEIEAEVEILCPGFIDLQVNGWQSWDVAAASPELLADLSVALASAGTTTFLPTLTTAPAEVFGARLAALDRAVSTSSVVDGAAETVGIHLEGPLLGSRHGAHPVGAVAEHDEETGRWLEALPSSVRLVTLGCESPRAPAAIAVLVRRGIVAALGHSSPDEASFDAAVSAGATVVTHLYNAMSGIHHREDGLAAMALTSDSVVATVIADGVHVGRRAATIAFRAKSRGTIALVSDSVAWASPRLVRAGVVLGNDGGARLPDGTLAGASVPVSDGVRRLVVDWGLDPVEVIRAATSTPARVLGLADRGRVLAGLRADLVALGNDFTVDRAWVGGRPARG